MLTLNAQQTAIIDSDNKTDISWLFEIDRTGDGTIDDYWTTKAKTYGGQDYTYKVLSFSDLRLERGRSEYSTQAQSSFNFILTNVNSTLLPSNFADGNVTVKWVVESWIRKVTVTVTGGTIPAAGATMTGVTSGSTAVLIGPPDGSWTGNKVCYFSSQTDSFQSENVSFTGGGTGTISEDLTYGREETLITTWNFDIVSVAPKYQTLYIECRDWLSKYLEGTYPNYPLIDDLWPSDKTSGAACVPLVFGTPYIPLASAYVNADSDRFYVLGPATGITYSITRSRSPMEVPTKTEWTSAAGFTFSQSSKTGSDSVSYRVFQLLGVIDVEEVSSNVLYQGLHGLFGGFTETTQQTINIGNNSTILSLPTEYSRNDLSSYTSPLDVLYYVLNTGYGIPASRLDSTTFDSTQATVDGWGLTWEVGLYEKFDRKVLLSILLQNCHVELVIRDKIYFKIHSKTSQKTITASLIIDNSFDYRWSRNKSLQDSGYVLYPDPSGDIPMSSPVRTEIPAKGSTKTVNSNIVIDCSFISSGSVHAQTLGILALQRQLLPIADVSFKAKAKILMIEPDDIVTISGANYGGDYDILVDSISINKNLDGVQISGTAFSDTLDDFTDLSPAAVVVSTDSGATQFQLVMAGPDEVASPSTTDPANVIKQIVKVSNNVGLSGLVSGSTDWRIWAGDTFVNRASAPFRVDDDGNLYATSATVTGMVTGSYLYGSSLMTKGTYLDISCTAGDTTLTVGNSADFPDSGTAYFIDSGNNDRDVFTYTSKTSTTLLGCSGVATHIVSATNKPLVIPTVKGIYISDAVNEIRFFGNRGDGTFDELASIGITLSGSDNYIGYFGHLQSSHVAIGAFSENNASGALIAQCQLSDDAGYARGALIYANAILDSAYTGTSLVGQVVLSWRGSGVTDNGALTALTGLDIEFGSKSASNGLTGTAKGLAIVPYYAGDITTLYGIYIQEPPLSSGTITNYYGIYQEDATAKNYFAGPIFLNETINTKNTLGLTLNQGSNDDEILSLKSSDIGHGVTTDTELDTYGLFKKYSDTAGGLLIRGLTDTNAEGGLILEGIISSTDPTDTNAALLLIGSKLSGTTTAALGDTETVLKIQNRTTNLMTVLGDGSLGIGITPTSQFHVLQATIGNEISRLESTATNSDPNYISIQARGETTDATATDIWTETPAEGTIVKYHAAVVARQTGGSAGTAGNGWGYDAYATMRMVSGLLTLIGGSTTLLVAQEDDTNFNVQWQRTTNVARLQVTGAIDKTITWHATIFKQTVET